MIAVADTDLLTDRMWVQVQDFFGQRVPQPFADNAGFAINALDNLAARDALLRVRSRGRFSRPFEVVEALQREAEAQFRVKEEDLQKRLTETDQKLASLQQQDPSKALELTPEQQAQVCLPFGQEGGAGGLLQIAAQEGGPRPFRPGAQAGGQGSGCLRVQVRLLEAHVQGRIGD